MLQYTELEKSRLFLLPVYRSYQINSPSFLLLNFKSGKSETRNLHRNLFESSGERTLDFHAWIKVFSTRFCRSSSAKSARSSPDLHLHPTPFSVIKSASSDVSLSKQKNKISFRRLCNFYQWRRKDQLLNSITKTATLLPLVQAAEPQMKKQQESGSKLFKVNRYL